MKTKLLAVLLSCIFTLTASLVRGEKQPLKTPIKTDRWLEIDLYWFDKQDLAASTDEFWERFHPLFDEADGWRGVILNVGWLTDYITDWQGNLQDTIPIVTGMAQQPWFSIRGHLSGNLSEKYAQWHKRFATPANVLRKDYEHWTYGELKELAEMLRRTAKRKYHLDQMKVGSFVLGWRQIYGSKPSGWALRHPEAYSSFTRNNDRNSTFNPQALLKSDTKAYASFPNGISEGLPATVFFGKQWGDLSKKVGLDALVLRDGMLGTGCYGNPGPFGPTLSPDTVQNNRMFNALSSLVKQAKLANPKALIIGYSSGASAVGDLRENAFDLEAIAQEGFLDAYIDQTWAGAWQETGVRHRQDDFFNNSSLGWTYQLGYMLIHAAQLANSRTRHYQLTETFDAWESWDVIHTVPERLKWGIWAYSHAAVKKPDGLKMPGGAYISWANQGTRLLSPDDVSFLSTQLDSAYSDAAQIKDVHGPTLVYNRAALIWQNKYAPAEGFKERVDEYAGSLMKWGLPILSATRIEYLDKIHTDLPVLQNPAHLSASQGAYLLKEIALGKPLVIIGSPASGIDGELSKQGGLAATASRGIMRKYGTAGSENNYSKNVDKVFSLRQLDYGNQPVGDVQVLYQVLDTLNTNGTTELSLQITDGGNGTAFDYANWGDVMLTDDRGNRTPLSGLEPYASSQGFAKLTRNTNTVGDSISIDGTAYKTGIGMHARSEAVYTLTPGKFVSLSGIAGLDDKQGQKGQVVARILINGTKYFQSEVLNSKNPAQAFDIVIPSKPKSVQATAGAALVKTTAKAAKRILTWDPPEFVYGDFLPILNNLGGNVAPYVISVRAMQDYLAGSHSPYLQQVEADKTMWLGAWTLKDGSGRLLTGNLEDGITFTTDKPIGYNISMPDHWASAGVQELWHQTKSAVSNGKLPVNLDYATAKLYKIFRK